MWMEVGFVHEWESWLDKVANETLPGGVSVVAVAGAMGAALVAKAIRVTLSRGELPPEERQRFEEAGAAAREAQRALVALSDDDEAAFRRLLETQKAPDDAGQSDERREAWLMVTHVPLQVADTCQELLHHALPLEKLCLPVVLVDLEIGTRLLLAGLDGGVRAGRANIEAWKTELKSDPQPADLTGRLQRLERKRL
jgi:formiminotetrahydrofolate cyclodeaminase